MFGDASVDEYCSPSGVAMEVFDYVNPSWRQGQKGKGRGKSNKRRFSDEQIRSLETIFESETRLDPGKKLQVARELGLQPRQVAIWFQNKRARWKSKQLEHDYDILRADYTRLASRLESLKQEKHALISELEKLKELTRKGATSPVTEGERSGEEDETELFKTEEPLAAAAAAPARSLSDDESSMKAEWYLGILEEEDDGHQHGHQEDSERLMMNVDVMDRGGGSLQSTRQGPSLRLNSDNLLYDTSPAQWWDFWS